MLKVHVGPAGISGPYPAADMELHLGTRVRLRSPWIEDTKVYGKVVKQHFSAMLMFADVPPVAVTVRWDDGGVSKHEAYEVEVAPLELPSREYIHSVMMARSSEIQEGQDP